MARDQPLTIFWCCNGPHAINRQHLADFALRSGFRAALVGREISAGGIMSYCGLCRDPSQAAGYADKILNGAKPTDFRSSSPPNSSC